MHVIKPPTPVTNDIHKKPSFFLAGSIEMGAAENWQATVTNSLRHHDCYVLNPRRDDWDSSWVQSIDNPQFREQVEWELLAQERADFILMYLHPATKAPISLLELGLFAMGPGGELIVCCPEGFYRKGNVDIVCDRYEIDTEPSLDRLIQRAIEEIKRWERTHSGTIERRLNG